VLRTRVQVHALAPFERGAGLVRAAGQRTRGEVDIGGLGAVEAFLLAAEHRQRRVEGPVIGELVVARPAEAGAGVVALVLRTDLDVVELSRVALARDDVDRAADRARTGLGGGRAQDLDALDLLGADRIDLETRRHAIAIEQDLRVAGTEAAKADLPAASRWAAERDAGQALEDLAQGR